PIQSIDLHAGPDGGRITWIAGQARYPRVQDARAFLDDLRRRLGPGGAAVLAADNSRRTGAREHCLRTLAHDQQRPDLSTIEVRRQTGPIAGAVAADEYSEFAAQKQYVGLARVHLEGADVALDKHAVTRALEGLA